MKIVFYLVFGIFALIAAWFVISSLIGKFNLWDLNQFQAKAVLIIASLSAVRLLYWAYQLGEIQGKYGQAIGITILALTAFQGIIFLGAILLSGRSKQYINKIFK